MSYVILRVFNFTDLTLERWADLLDNNPVPNANTPSALKIGLLLFFLTHSLKKVLKTILLWLKSFENLEDKSEIVKTHIKSNSRNSILCLFGVLWNLQVIPLSAIVQWQNYKIWRK